jgi:sugar phosphate isomerase/epimerase
MGLCDWERVINFLKEKGYTGDICLPAEYDDIKNTAAYVKMDLDYIKSLVAK